MGISEMMNGGSKAQRFTNSIGNTLPVPIGALPANMGEFESLDRYFRVMRPPEHLKDLTAIVSSRLIPNPMRIIVRASVGSLPCRRYHAPVAATQNAVVT